MDGLDGRNFEGRELKIQMAKHDRSPWGSQGDTGDHIQEREEGQEVDPRIIAAGDVLLQEAEVVAMTETDEAENILEMEETEITDHTHALAPDQEVRNSPKSFSSDPRIQTMWSLQFI